MSVTNAGAQSASAEPGIEPVTISIDAVGSGAGADQARLLFRYLSGEEWQEYRAILSVFADTFFAEFAPEDVILALREHPVDIDDSVVPDRLESLRRWGNLSASTSVGNPASLSDYYKRRHRYLITRAGQEVFDKVEGILHRVDHVSDVQAGRLRDLHRALESLILMVDRGIDKLPTTELVDTVRRVFDAHESFSTEITQFFASINQWQSRFDLEPDEVTFFANVLVGYVSEQLQEIERMARPIAGSLRVLEPSLHDIVTHSRSGLAARVDDAGLTDTVLVRHVAGSERDDWTHLMGWFGARDNGDSRLDALTRQALAAVRTLTGNLTRLSRVGAGVASRRADFIRLAGFIDSAPGREQVQNIMAAAFGLFPSRHLGVLSADAEDPVSTATPWSLAPRAEVPVSLRERGERNQRGSVTPVRDRAAEREHLRYRRLQEREAESETAQELLRAVTEENQIIDINVSNLALRRLRLLLGASGARRRPGHTQREAIDADLRCCVMRAKGKQVSIRCPDGCLCLLDVEVFLWPATAMDSNVSTDSGARLASNE